MNYDYDYEKIEKKLDRLKKKIQADEEVWMKLPNFWEYEISSFGRIKSLETIEKRACPKTGKILDYVRKEAFLKPLFTGPNRRWVSAKLSLKKGEHRQFSLAKLLLSTFLKVPLKELPHSVFFINWDSHDVRLHNLTFIRKNIGK